MNAKLLNKTSSTVTVDAYEIEIAPNTKVVLIEYLNDKGKVIDSNFRDENGTEIDDPALLEKVQEFVDSQE